MRVARSETTSRSNEERRAHRHLREAIQNAGLHAELTAKGEMIVSGASGTARVPIPASLRPAAKGTAQERAAAVLLRVFSDAAKYELLCGDLRDPNVPAHFADRWDQERPIFEAVRAAGFAATDFAHAAMRDLGVQYLRETLQVGTSLPLDRDRMSANPGQAVERDVLAVQPAGIAWFEIIDGRDTPPSAAMRAHLLDMASGILRDADEHGTTLTWYVLADRGDADEGKPALHEVLSFGDDLAKDTLVAAKPWIERDQLQIANTVPIDAEYLVNRCRSERSLVQIKREADRAFSALEACRNNIEGRSR